MKNRRKTKNLAATFDEGQIVEGQIVRVDRSPEIDDEIDGYIVGVSELFVMSHVLAPDVMTLNGYTVLRVEDINHCRVRGEGKSFLGRALKLNGIEPVPQPDIDLSSYSALLTSANARFPLITIHRELMDAEICFIGRVHKLTGKTITLEEINPAAKWKRSRSYSFKDITRIDFGGGYEEALALVSEHDAKK